MNNSDNAMPRRPRNVAILLGTPAAILACVPAISAEYTFNPEITIGGIYSDNLALAPAGEEESDVVGLVRPGLSLGARGQRVQANLEYELQAYYFGEGERDQTFHQLDGNLESEVVQDLLFFDATARRAQTIIDPELLVPYSNFVVTENRADYTAWQANPYVQREIANTARLRLSYSHGDLQYSNIDEDVGVVQDFTDDIFNFTLASLSDERVYWELRYNNERVEYETAAAVEYEIATLSLGWRLTPSLQLIGRGGRESDLRETQATSTVESDTWNAGFRWRPQNHEVEITVGERFFGQTYTANWAYTGNRLVAGVDYSESPLTVGQQLFQLPVLTNPLPGDPGNTLTALTPEVYLSELTTAWFGIVGRRNRMQLTVYKDAREFFSTAEEEEETGALFDWDWRLGPRTTVFMDMEWQRIGYRGSERNDEFGNVSLGIGRQLGSATWVTLTGRHAYRTSDATPISPLYEENGAMLEVTHRFGRPPVEETVEDGAAPERFYRGRRGESVLRGR